MTPEALTMVADRFKVLSDVTRLRILQYLMSGERSVAEIAESAECTQPNTSKHLKILHRAGILSRKQSGNTVLYSISDPGIFDLCDNVCKQIRDHYVENIDLLKFRR